MIGLDPSVRRPKITIHNQPSLTAPEVESIDNWDSITTATLWEGPGSGEGGDFTTPYRRYVRRVTGGANVNSSSATIPTATTQILDQHHLDSLVCARPRRVFKLNPFGNSPVKPPLLSGWAGQRFGSRVAVHLGWNPTSSPGMELDDHLKPHHGISSCSLSSPRSPKTKTRPRRGCPFVSVLGS